MNTTPNSSLPNNAEAVRKKRIYLATPCYGGLLSASYTNSLLMLQQVLLQHNYGLYIYFLSNESLINRARNGIVADFLGQTEYDYLLFIDADIGFTAQTILDMIAYDKPVTVARVPLKGIDWTAAFNSRLQVNSMAELADSAMTYNINYAAESNVPLEIDAKGFAKVEMAGTALMLIKREVFDVLREKLPHARYVNDIANYNTPFSKNNFWLFFEPMPHPDSGRYLSEDFAFCYRWRHYGNGEIYAYMKAEVSHLGTYKYCSYTG